MKCRFFRNINWPQRGVPIFLSAYVLYAIFASRDFAVSDFESVSPQDISPELEITELQQNNDNQTMFRPKCPLLPSQDDYVWNEIVQNSSLSEAFYLTTEDLGVSYNPFTINDFHTHVGGRWEPKTCHAQHYVALIIPYKSRADQLRKFLIYMHTFLQIQMIQYQIFVVEQLDDVPFNRGKLFNIGFVEASKTGGFRCFIFHDIDLLPENIQNIYGCTRRPRHMSAVVDSFRYTLQYEALFGGVISITSKLFKLVNGFSNQYFGWGGEDDDFRQRLNVQQVESIRFPPHISSYRMIPHVKENPSNARFEKLHDATKDFQLDGLNNLKYNVVNFVTLPLYTLIQVKILNT